MLLNRNLGRLTLYVVLRRALGSSGVSSSQFTPPIRAALTGGQLDDCKVVNSIAVKNELTKTTNEVTTSRLIEHDFAAKHILRWNVVSTVNHMEKYGYHNLLHHHLMSSADTSNAVRWMTESGRRCHHLIVLDDDADVRRFLGDVAEQMRDGPHLEIVTREEYEMLMFIRVGLVDGGQFVYDSRSSARIRLGVCAGSVRHMIGPMTGREGEML